MPSQISHVCFGESFRLDLNASREFNCTIASRSDNRNLEGTFIVDYVQPLIVDCYLSICFSCYLLGFFPLTSLEIVMHALQKLEKISPTVVISYFLRTIKFSGTHENLYTLYKQYISLYLWVFIYVLKIIDVRSPCFQTHILGQNQRNFII